MEKCECWEVIFKTECGDGFNRAIPVQTCNGTKEREECTCGGDVTKCNFYPEKRKEGKYMNTAEMWLKAQKDGKTYTCENMRYNKEHGFHFNTGLKIKGFHFDYPENIFELEWKLKPDNEMTKSEAEAKFNIKIVGD